MGLTAVSGSGAQEPAGALHVRVVDGVGVPSAGIPDARAVRVCEGVPPGVRVAEGGLLPVRELLTVGLGERVGVLVLVASGVQLVVSDALGDEELEGLVEDDPLGLGVSLPVGVGAGDVVAGGVAVGGSTQSQLLCPSSTLRVCPSGQPTLAHVPYVSPSSQYASRGHVRQNVPLSHVKHSGVEPGAYAALHPLYWPGTQAAPDARHCAATRLGPPRRECTASATTTLTAPHFISHDKGALAYSARCRRCCSPRPAPAAGLYAAPAEAAAAAVTGNKSQRCS